MGKKCRLCGKLINNNYDLCYDCKQSQKNKLKLPKDYLANGYFNEKKILNIDLIDKTAKLIAQLISDKMTSGQLRKFYGHAKRIYNQIQNGAEFEELEVEIKKITAFVAEARGKNKVGNDFYRFICINMSCIKDYDTFMKGFIPHFEAVVAYFTYYNSKK